MKKIILFSYLLCCFNLFAFSYNSKGEQCSTLDQEKEDNTNNPGNQMNDSSNNQEAFNEARKKESEITELGEKLDDLDNEALKLLEEIDLLDDKARETLEYRKKYPEASLKELAEIISFETNKKLSKSGLNHRLRKIKDLAEQLEKHRQKEKD